MKTTATSILQELIDSLVNCFSKEVAARIVALRASAAVQARLDEFAEKNEKGQLTKNESEHCDALIRCCDYISLVQASSRKMAARSLRFIGT